MGSRTTLKKIIFLLLILVLISNNKNIACAKKYVKSLKVDKNVSIKVGESKKIKYKLSVVNYANKNITADSLNKEVAVAHVKKGKIIIVGNKQGKAKIKVTSKGKNIKGKNIVKTIKVTVYPTYLVDLPVLNSTEEFRKGDIYYDRLQNQYNKAFLIGKPTGSTYHEWYLNGKYNHISGVLAFSDKDNMSTDYNYCGIIQIYADDNLIYTSPEINYKTEPIIFDMDISGAKILKIVHKRECELIVDSCILSK